MSTNRVKEIEDFICDTLDATFDDSIKTQKEFDAKRECRAVQFDYAGRSPDDQHTMIRTTVNFTSLRKNRSDAIADIDKLYKKFPIYNTFVDNSLAISVVLGYITSPMRTIVESHYGWTYTATFEVTAT